MEHKMTSEYVSTLKNKDDVEEGGITLVKKEDGTWAVPGGFYVTNEGYAKAVAKRLNYEFNMPKPPKDHLADKVVTRLTAASREGVDMVLGV
jgi:ADP-ribose pyrophosphatase YjhB (NUDIX family)